MHLHLRSIPSSLFRLQVDFLPLFVPQWLMYGRALSMPPSWFDFLAAQWNATKYGGPNPTTQPGLFDARYGLWWVESSVVNSTTPNQQPSFWARGNAWAAVTVMKALDANVLPAGDPLRADLESTLVAMANALLQAQNTTDGLWRSSLSDSLWYSNPETTGSAGFTAMLAFGVRSGLLDSSTFVPAIARAWQGLSSISLQPDGLVGFCQPSSGAPGPAQAGDTSDFCAGLVLLAASQVYKLVA
jgi:hypothetical protein